MTKRLYLLPIPESEAQTAENAVRSQIAQSGLLEQAGIAVENISTENIDATVSGQYRAGPLINRKLADELDSLSESGYTALPLYDSDGNRLERVRGYYEIADASIEPAGAVGDGVYTYTLGLTNAGTPDSDWRAVTTRDEAIQTGLTAGETAFVSIPTQASQPQWFDRAAGTEPASATDTVEAEFGRLDRYDPDDSTFDDPTLIYASPFGAEGRVDVRVWDDRGRDSKTVTAGSVSGQQYDSLQYDSAQSAGVSAEITVWTHAFHPGYVFDGEPILDNGRVRVHLRTGQGDLRAYRWDSGWTRVPLTLGNYRLDGYDFTTIGAALTDVRTEWTNTSTGDAAVAVLSLQRGYDDVIVREPDNDTLPGGLETALSPIASGVDTDRRPSQTTRSKSGAR
jgi:hypothetical protein